jgi:hypothetical protein
MEWRPHRDSVPLAQADRPAPQTGRPVEAVSPEGRYVPTRNGTTCKLLATGGGL